VAQAVVKKFNIAREKKEASRTEPEVLASQYPVTAEDFARVVKPYEYSRRPTRCVGMANLNLGEKELVRVGVSVAHKGVPEEDLRALVPRASYGRLKIVGDTEPAGENFAEWLETGLEGWNLERTHACLQATRQSALMAVEWQQLNGFHGKHADTIILLMDDTGDSALAAAWEKAQQQGAHLHAVFTTDMVANQSAFLQARRLKAILPPQANWSIGVAMTGFRLGQVGLVRMLVAYLEKEQIRAPLVWRYRILRELSNGNAAATDWMIDCSGQLGSLFCDGLGDAMVVEGAMRPADTLRFSYNLLQAARLRISKTEFISCPSCGRTLFNLQTTTERIKSKTNHLKGVKIAIMGCIVNGPGEMADADFGYVGTGPKVVSLYVGKECVQRNIPEDEADARLIELIKAHGKWVEAV
jgi:hypothetical protein